MKHGAQLRIWVGDKQAAFVTAVYGSMTLEDMETVSNMLRSDDADALDHFWSQIPPNVDEVECILAWEGVDEHYIEGGEIRSINVYSPMFINVRAYLPKPLGEMPDRVHVALNRAGTRGHAEEFGFDGSTEYICANVVAAQVKDAHLYYRRILAGMYLHRLEPMAPHHIGALWSALDYKTEDEIREFVLTGKWEQP